MQNIDKLLELYAAGERDFCGADIAYETSLEADLSDADLSKADLFRVNLTDANLNGANLSGACLTEAILSGANLKGAKLCGANLMGANLSYNLSTHTDSTDLSDANLSNADLAEANLIQARLTNANLQGANLRASNLAYAKLDGANLSNANLMDANLAGADLNNAELKGANLNRTIFEPIGINHCVKFSPKNRIIHWKRLRFRSNAEVQIAEALDRAGVLYFANSMARLTTPKGRKNKEPDFLVCCDTLKGFRWGILEVDGPFHTPKRRVEEQERERFFEHSGVRVHRFDGKRCQNQPDNVVREFIEILSKW